MAEHWSREAETARLDVSGPEWVLQYGDPDVAFAGEILRSVVGSGVHGIAIEGTDDHDEMGVFIEPPEYLLGVRTYREDFIARTQPEGARSGPGDTDLVMYGLRKYLRLAMKGNPTALLPLYAPESDLIVATDLGNDLRRHRDWFLSAEAVERFLGYMHSQHERMMGRGRQGRVPNRPELIQSHGWDTKFGSHALRLAYQGYEIATTGHLALPLESTIRAHVLSVKRGEVPRDEVSHEISRLEEHVREVLERGDGLAVPDHPNVAAIEAWAMAAYRDTWEATP